MVRSELTAAFRFIARNRGIGHLRKDLTDLPVRFWAVYSYLIIYRPDRSPVYIVAVIHAARNVEKLLARLDE